MTATPDWDIRNLSMSQVNNFVAEKFRAKVVTAEALGFLMSGSPPATAGAPCQTCLTWGRECVPTR